MLYNYQEFINENKLNEGFFDKVLRSLKGWASKPLNDFLKNISKSGDPKKIINNLRTYIQSSEEGIDIALKKIESKDQLKSYLNQTLMGIYTALKGVQSTQKVDKTFFDEIFKRADKNLVKVMGYKENEIYSAIQNYVNEILIPNLYKISDVNKMSENYLFEDEKYTEYEMVGDKKDEEKKIDKEIDETEEKIKEEDKVDDKIKEEDKVDDKMRGVVKNWLTNIFSPILKTRAPRGNDRGSGDNIKTSSGNEIGRNVVQNMIKSATTDDIKKFRKIIKKPMGREGEKRNKIWPIKDR